MKWLAKSAAQRAFALMPRTEELNYLAQTRITRGLPRNDERFVRKIGEGARHVRVLRDFFSADSFDTLELYEFGTGWDMTIPLLFYSIGVDRQTTTDVRALIRPELVTHTLRQFAKKRNEVERIVAGSTRSFDTSPVGDRNDLVSRFGITYLAPVDTTTTGLPRASFEFICSTETLEHVPESQIGPLLRECRRLLKPAGVMSHDVDMEDHYSYMDRRISGYNFLRFSDRAWRLLNSPLEHQNRLRLPDYKRMIVEAGFRILESDVRWGTPDDLRSIDELGIAPRFRDYSPEELAAKSAHFVLST